MELGEIGIWRRHQDGADGAGRDRGAGLRRRCGSAAARRWRRSRPFLERSSTLTVATGILNVWQHEPADVAAQRAELARDVPRALPARDRRRASGGDGGVHEPAGARWRAFFDGLDAAREPVPRDERVAAALGPKMLDARGRSARWGRTPTSSRPSTRASRASRSGPTRSSRRSSRSSSSPTTTTARAAAREYAALYLGLRNYTSNLLRFGFTERDVADGGSDRLIDAVIPHGSAERSPRPSARTSTRAPTTSRCSRSATAPRRSPTTRRCQACCSRSASPAGGACPPGKACRPGGEATSAPPTLGPWPPSTRPSTARDCASSSSASAASCSRAPRARSATTSARWPSCRAACRAPSRPPTRGRSTSPTARARTCGTSTATSTSTSTTASASCAWATRNPAIVAAVSERAGRGSHFAAPTEGSIVVAEELARRFGLPQWRFTNSGTESTMDAIHLARAATGRDLVLKIEGSYHGHHDAVMVSVRPPLDQLGERGVAGQRALRRRPPARGERADEGDPVQRRRRARARARRHRRPGRRAHPRAGDDEHHHRRAQARATSSACASSPPSTASCSSSTRSRRAPPSPPAAPSSASASARRRLPGQGDRRRLPQRRRRA